MGLVGANAAARLGAAPKARSQWQRRPCPAGAAARWGARTRRLWRPLRLRPPRPPLRPPLPPSVGRPEWPPAWPASRDARQ
jgi:hypothetical protein